MAQADCGSYQDTTSQLVLSCDLIELSHYTPPGSSHTTTTSTRQHTTSTMAMSGVKLTAACMTLYDEIQKGKKHRLVQYGVEYPSVPTLS